MIEKGLSLRGAVAFRWSAILNLELLKKYKTERKTVYEGLEKLIQTFDEYLEERFGEDFSSLWLEDAENLFMIDYTEKDINDFEPIFKAFEDCRNAIKKDTIYYPERFMKNYTRIERGLMGYKNDFEVIKEEFLG